MLPQQEEVVTLHFVISIPDLQGHLPSGEASCPADSTPHSPQSCSTPRPQGSHFTKEELRQKTHPGSQLSLAVVGQDSHGESYSDPGGR